MTGKSRSPLDRFLPLRMPGQSVQDELDKVMEDQVEGPLLLALMMLAFAAFEWLRYLFKLPPYPVAFSIAAAVFVGYAIYKLWKARKRIAQLKLGRDGERAVAHYLEWFRSAGFFVFHDVPSGDANVDHVLIGEKGIYTIETKTLSKPVRGECRVAYVNNGQLAANGHVMDRNPLVQAKAQANWLRHFLAESRFDVFIQPVVVFPGWFVEPFDMRAAGAWVLEPKALSKFIENEPLRLSREQVQAIASALRSHVRSRPSAS